MIMGAISDLSWDTEGGPMTIKQRGTREMLTALEMGDQSEVGLERDMLLFFIKYSFIIVLMIYIYIYI
jgi:hypothetical protein